MIHIRDELVVARPAADVWAFLERFDDFARCVPTLKEWRVDGETITGKVGVVLGAVPVESNVELEITDRRPPCCIEARGISFLGETIANLRGGREGQVRRADSGRVILHLDVCDEGGGRTRLRYLAGVEAEGRLRKVYESILRLKVPAMKQEFAAKVAAALGVEVARVEASGPMCAAAEAIVTGEPRALAPAPPAPPVAPARRSLWARLLAWLRALFARTGP
jgi:carbon monoxide dehydrogenase subunit G